MLSGLLIRSPYIDWILAGTKTWEIRGSSNAKRGRIGQRKYRCLKPLLLTPSW
jgi:hypothetical protein